MPSRDTPKFTMATAMVRKPGGPLTVVVDTATPPVNGTTIDYRHYAAGRVIVAATIASTTLTWYESTDGDTFVPCYNGGNAVTSTLPGGAAASCEIPASLAGCQFLRITTNADDAESVTVVLKA